MLKLIITQSGKTAPSFLARTYYTRKTSTLAVPRQLLLQFFDDVPQLQLLRLVHDLHVADHAVFLHLCFARFLRGVVDADALATLGGAARSHRLQLPLQANYLGEQLVVGPAHLL